MGRHIRVRLRQHELRSAVAVIRAGLEAPLDDLLLLAAHDENGTSASPARPVDLTALAVDETRRPRGVPVLLTRHRPTPRR